VGGNITYEGQYPWMVAIYLHGNGKREFWCGGKNISNLKCEQKPWPKEGKKFIQNSLWMK